MFIEIGKLIIENAPSLIGFLMPPIVDYLNKEVYGENEKAIIAILVCMIATALLNWDKLLYDSIYSVLISFGLIFTESQVVYKFYFKNSYLRSKIQSFYLHPEIIQ